MTGKLSKKYWTLRKDLHGHYGKIAEACNTSVSTVSRVLSKEIKNDDVLFKAIEIRKQVVKERKEKERSRIKKLKSIQ